MAPQARYQPLNSLGLALAREMNETDFQNDLVIPMAEYGGWKVMHISDSRKQVGGELVGDAGTAGYPDLHLVHPRYGEIHAELKRQVGWKWRKGQRDWLDAFAEVAAVQADWATSAAAHLGDAVVDLLGPMPRVYAALWRPEDLPIIEHVLVHHRLDLGVWWPDNDPGGT